MSKNRQKVKFNLRNGPAFANASRTHGISELGHFGVELAMKKLRIKYPDVEWPYMREHVKHLISRCPICQKLSAIKTVVVTKPFTVA